MNSNRKAEKTRVISELNKGYKDGGRGYEVVELLRGGGVVNKSIMKS